MQKVGVKRRRPRVWIAILVVLGVLIVGMGIAVLVFEPGRKEALNLSIGTIDFDHLKDGVYTGAYKGTKDHFRDTKVEVTVSSGELAEIHVIEGALANEKQNTEVRNGQSINDLLNRVIKSETLQVDVISGATISSKVHLKAVENALIQAEAK